MRHLAGDSPQHLHVHTDCRWQDEMVAVVFDTLWLRCKNPHPCIHSTHLNMDLSPCSLSLLLVVSTILFSLSLELTLWKLTQSKPAQSVKMSRHNYTSFTAIANTPRLTLCNMTTHILSEITQYSFIVRQCKAISTRTKFERVHALISIPYTVAAFWIIVANKWTHKINNGYNVICLKSFSKKTPSVNYS